MFDNRKKNQEIFITFLYPSPPTSKVLLCYMVLFEQHCWDMESAPLLLPSQDLIKADVSIKYSLLPP